MTILREERIGGQRLILGDCREVMPTLGRFDAVVTDPPYGIAHASNYGASWNGRQIASDQDTGARDYVADLIGDDVPSAFFGTWKTPPVKGTRACVVWDKGPAFGMGDLSVPWKPSFELFYIRGNGWSGSRDQGVLRGPVQVSWENTTNIPDSDRRKHPHQKPVWLIEHILRKAPDAKTILDPFMGSGTTLVACQRLGRQGTGIEIDPGYFETACERVHKAWREPDLFIKDAPPPPVQESLL